MSLWTRVVELENERERLQQRLDQLALMADEADRLRERVRVLVKENDQLTAQINSMGNQ